MKKNVLIGLGVVLGVSFLFNILQLTTGNSKRKQIKKLKSSLTLEKEKADTLEVQYNDLTVDVNSLQDENVQLADSVVYLNKKIRRLRSKIKGYTSRLETLQSSMAFLEEKHATLESQIANQLQADKADDSQVQVLQQEKAALEQKIQAMIAKNDSLEEVKESLYEQVLKKEEEKQEYIKKDEVSKKTLDIIQNTTVEFFEVFARKKNQKRARSAKRWHDTVINLSLLYETQEDLNNQEFLIKIMDTSTGKIVSPRENSESDTPGISFIFVGNPAPTITYSNYEKKKGENYVVQVYLVQDGTPYLLSQGTSAIVF